MELVEQHNVHGHAPKRELWREATTMVLYITIVLLAELAVESGDEEPDVARELDHIDIDIDIGVGEGCGLGRGHGTMLPTMLS